MGRQLATTSTAQLNAFTEPRRCTETGATRPSAMDTLWHRFDQLFGDRWNNRFPDPVRDVTAWCEQWSQDLLAEGISGAELGRGYESLRRCKFPPSFYEFVCLCRPTMDPEVAYAEAMREMPKRHHPKEIDGQLVSTDVWTEPAVYWAAARLWTELQAQPWKEIRTRWEQELERARAQRKPMPPQVCRALPPPKPEPSIAPEQQKALIGDLLRKLGKRSVPQPVKTGRQDGFDLEDAKRRAQAEAELALMRRRKTEGA